MRCAYEQPSEHDLFTSMKLAKGSISQCTYSSELQIASPSISISHHFSVSSHPSLSPCFSPLPPPFPPPLYHLLAGNLSEDHLRYAALPRETVCTENFTPWKKLLPCDNQVPVGGDSALVSVVGVRSNQSNATHRPILFACLCVCMM